MRLFILAAIALTAAPALTQPATRTCIPNAQIRESRTTDAHEIIVRTGKSWWRNTANSCTFLKSTTAYSTVSPQSQLCRGDIINVADLSQHFVYGGCPLGEWEQVPRPAN